MALSKEIIADKIEILEDGTIQIREITRIREDDTIISSKITNRRIIAPGDSYDNEDSKISDIAQVVHKTEIVAAYKKKKEDKAMLNTIGKGD